MALLFSAVTMTANGEQAKFLVGGIPRSSDDLEGWRAYERFLVDIDKTSDVQVTVDSYLYGEEEIHTATPEEVAYFMKRQEMDSDFIQDRCRSHGTSSFQFNWSPEELFGMRELNL